jgi:hypothetical protein
MKKHLFLSVILFLLASCGEAVKEDQSELTIPKEGFTFQIPQRSGIEVPATGKKIIASINDITGGQTLFTMKADSTTFFSSAIHDGDTLKFNYNDSKYRVICIDLINNLIGEDVANLKIENQN